MGSDISRATPEDAVAILADPVLYYMKTLHVPNGLSVIGYTPEDIPKLLEETLPQHRVSKLLPRLVGREEPIAIFEDAMTYW